MKKKSSNQSQNKDFFFFILQVYPRKDEKRQTQGCVVNSQLNDIDIYLNCYESINTMFIYILNIIQDNKIKFYALKFMIYFDSI